MVNIPLGVVATRPPTPKCCANRSGSPLNPLSDCPIRSYGRRKTRRGCLAGVEKVAGCVGGTLADMYPAIERTMTRFLPLGERVFESSVHKVGHVPHVAPEAWLHIVFPSHPDLLVTLEERRGRPLPEELQRMYRVLNGAHLFSGNLSIDGHRARISRTGPEPMVFDIKDSNTYPEWPDDATPEMVFFGTIGQYCSLYARDDESGIFCSERRVSARPLMQWPSIEAMIETEVARLDEAFDDDGKAKEGALLTPVELPSRSEKRLFGIRRGRRRPS